MRCPKCETEVAEGARFCPQCGAELPEAAAVGAPRTSANAILSLVLGILAIIPLIGLLSGVAAIILGIVALSAIARSRGILTGQGLATAGIIVASVLIFFNFFMTAAIVIPNFLEAQIRSKVSRAKTDMRSIATGLESYFVDNNCYPAWGIGEDGANSFAGPEAGVYHVPTFRIWKNEKEKETFRTLTTPIAYLPSISDFRDPFADTEGATFCYYCDSDGWVLWSWGPDCDESEREQWDLAPDVDKVYHMYVAQPSYTLLAGTSSAPAHEAYTYDPTNGTVSPGDIWRVKY